MITTLSSTTQWYVDLQFDSVLGKWRFPKCERDLCTKNSQLLFCMEKYNCPKRAFWSFSLAAMFFLLVYSLKRVRKLFFDILITIFKYFCYKIMILLDGWIFLEYTGLLIHQWSSLTSFRLSTKGIFSVDLHLKYLLCYATLMMVLIIFLDCQFQEYTLLPIVSAT